MFRNLNAEQRRFNMSNQQLAEFLGFKDRKSIEVKRQQERSHCRSAKNSQGISGSRLIICLKQPRTEQTMSNVNTEKLLATISAILSARYGVKITTEENK